MVRAQVAILADAVRVVGAINVRALVGEFFPSTLMVTIFTHALGIEGHRSVRTRSYILLFIRHFLLLRLIASVATAFRQFLTEGLADVFSCRKRLRNHQGLL